MHGFSDVTENQTNTTNMKDNMRTIKQLFDLVGKTALVTGRFSGIGMQITEALKGQNLVPDGGVSEVH